MDFFIGVFSLCRLAVSRRDCIYVWYFYYGCCGAYVLLALWPFFRSEYWSTDGATWWLEAKSHSRRPPGASAYSYYRKIGYYLISICLAMSAWIPAMSWFLLATADNKWRVWRFTHSYHDIYDFAAVRFSHSGYRFQCDISFWLLWWFPRAILAASLPRMCRNCWTAGWVRKRTIFSSVTGGDYSTKDVPLGSDSPVDYDLCRIAAGAQV